MKIATEERIIAVLAHLSALALGMGVFIPAIFWSTQREKSKYVAFQSLQAYGYQTLGYTLWMLVYLALCVAMLVVLTLTALLIDARPSLAEPVAILWLSMLLLGALGLIGVYLLIPVIAAVMCALGRDFRYPFLGERLAKFVGYAPETAPDASLSDPAMDRFAAAMGHFSVIFLFWGLVGPLALWVLEGKRSALLRFQSAQNVVYQALGTLFYFVFMLGYVFSAFIAISLMEVPANEFPIGIAALFMMLCSIAALGLLGPLYHILGQWAGLQVLRGQAYRFPLLGRWVARFLSPPETRATPGPQ